MCVCVCWVGNEGARAERLMTAVFRDPVAVGRGPNRTVELSELLSTKRQSKKSNYMSNTLVSKDFR